MTAYELAERTKDSFSFKRYANWTAVCRMLLRMGYSDEAAEELLRSKITRWAADESRARYGKATSKDVERYILRYPDACDFTKEKP